MKAGFFAPLPPARTGVADYAAALLGALQQLGRVEVNAADAGVFLYHLGNNQLHREIYQRALERPGVVVLHDAVLHHFHLGNLHERDYIREFAYNYGPWTEDLARDLWQGRSRSATDPRYFQFPMLKRVAERSLAVIVHNPAAAAMVKQHASDARIYEIPHLFEQPDLPPGYEVVRLRKALGLQPETFLFGVFGHLRESKRLASILRAFGRVRRGCDAALLVAGGFASPDLARSIEPLLRGDGILRAGYMPERGFWRYASAVDACINLRYPAAGETSGIAIRLMGIGKPVILSAGCETVRFPEAACLRVDTGLAEEAMLEEFMTWLARFPEDARSMGRRAEAHIRKFHAIGKVAEDYWHVLADCYHQ